MEVLELVKDKEQAAVNVAVKEQVLEQQSIAEQALDQPKENGKREELAILLGKSQEQLEREFIDRNVSEFLSHAFKAAVGSDAMVDGLKCTLNRVKEWSLGGAVLSTVYLPNCAKILKKRDGKGVKVGAIIDFPFGEGTVKSKINQVKACNKAKVDFVIMTLPSILLNAEEGKDLKKQVKKFAGAFKKEKSVAVNFSDLRLESLSGLNKIMTKKKINSLTLILAEGDSEDLAEKIIAIKSRIGEKSIDVLAPVSGVEQVTELVKLGVDKIFTPNAEELAKSVIDAFEING